VNRPLAKLLAAAAIEAAEWHENNVVECTCSDPEEYGTCWYRLTPTEQRSSRIHYIADRLEDVLDDNDLYEAEA
jgi:hypothetical protein